MKAIGTILLLLGGALLFFGLNMDTSVSTYTGGYGDYGFPSRVNNIGLLNQQVMLVIGGAISLLGSLVAFGFGIVLDRLPEGQGLTPSIEQERIPYADGDQIPSGTTTGPSAMQAVVPIVILVAILGALGAMAVLSSRSSHSNTSTSNTALLPVETYNSTDSMGANMMMDDTPMNAEPPSQGRR